MIRALFVIPAALAFAACGDDDTTTDTSDVDTSTDASDVADTTDPSDIDTTTDASDIDTTTDASDVADTDAGEVVDNPWGFPIRTPASHHLACESDRPESLDTLDTDWLCTFAHDGVTGHIYTQSTPTACEVTFAGQPIFGSNSGWLARAGEPLAQLTDVEYDWGGNHHNDSLVFSWNGRAYRYYHSSIGFGFRKCHDVDCMQVRAADGTLIEDGCTPERTLPIVCRQVAADGTWEELVDTFERCPGDPNLP